MCSGRVLDSKFKNIGHYILFLSLIINLDYTTLTLSISESSLPKYNHAISKARHNNFPLKPKSSYLHSTTSGLSSNSIFYSNLSSMLPMDNPSKYELSLT